MKTFNQLHPIAQQAAWHFVESNREGSDVGAITDPYRYGYTVRRELDLYPDWQRLTLDYEVELCTALESPDSPSEAMADYERTAMAIVAKL